jgi:hypothetical protein
MDTSRDIENVRNLLNNLAIASSGNPEISIAFSARHQTTEFDPRAESQKLKSLPAPSRRSEKSTLCRI